MLSISDISVWHLKLIGANSTIRLFTVGNIFISIMVKIFILGDMTPYLRMRRLIKVDIEEKVDLTLIAGSVMAIGGLVALISTLGNNIGWLLIPYLIISLLIITMAMNYIQDREDKRSSELSDAEKISCDP